MKQFKISIIAMIVTIAVIILCGSACAHAENRPEFYPKLTVVFETETVGNSRIVYCVDKTQNVWAFYDNDNEYEVGDIANLLMWAVGEDPEMDEIIEVYWEGYTENIESFFN